MHIVISSIRGLQVDPSIRVGIIIPLIVHTIYISIRFEIDIYYLARVGRSNYENVSLCLASNTMATVSILLQTKHRSTIPVELLTLASVFDPWPGSSYRTASNFGCRRSTRF
jgi:hypothetical protein